MSRPTLYLIPVPLASDTVFEVLSPAILHTLPQIKTFFVENVRTARRFLSDLKIGMPIDQLTFIELTKETPFAVTFSALKKLTTQAAVLSEAGCPGVADPGANAVAAAHALGWQVKPLVGPSSILLALMASGFSGQQFAFHGYLPIDRQERATALKKLEREALTKRQTQIFMETPYRNNQLLETLLKVCNASTYLTIATDLTAVSEFVSTKSVAEWGKNIPNLHKRPTIFLLGVLGNEI